MKNTAVWLRGTRHLIGPFAAFGVVTDAGIHPAKEP